MTTSCESKFFETEAVLILAKGEVSPSWSFSRGFAISGTTTGPNETEPWHKTLLALKRFQNDHGLPVDRDVPIPTPWPLLRESYCY